MNHSPLAGEPQHLLRSSGVGGWGEPMKLVEVAGPQAHEQ